MQLVRENTGHIFRNIVFSDWEPVCFIVNFPLYAFTALTHVLLHEQINVVCYITRGKFQVNVGFTRILRHKVMAELLFKGEHDKECVLYRDDIDREANIASKCAYPGTWMVKSHADIDKLVERLLNVD